MDNSEKRIRLDEIHTVLSMIGSWYLYNGDTDKDIPRAYVPGDVECALEPRLQFLKDLKGGLATMDLNENNREQFVTKDSGARAEFDTGSQRDSQEGKPRYDLIPIDPLKRLADLYARGAEKYEERNWEKGQPFSRLYASMFRHMMQWREGDRDEDHLAAVIFNAMAIMEFEKNKPGMDDIHARD